MDFLDNLVKHLSEQLDKPEEDIRNALDSVCTQTTSSASKPVKTTTKKETTTKKAPPAKKTTNVKVETHTCERVKRGKTEPCGNNAKNCDDDVWYCNACYKVQIKKKETPTAKNQKVKNNDTKKDKKVCDLLDTLTKKQQIRMKNKTVNGVEYLYSPDENILFDKKHNAVGLYDEKKKIKLPLTKDKIRWCETHNLDVVREKKKKQVEVEESEAEEDNEAEEDETLEESEAELEDEDEDALEDDSDEDELQDESEDELEDEDE